MDAIQALADRLTRLPAFIEDTVMSILDENSELLEKMNREQMFEGLDSEGKGIRPKYSEDPYFKSPEAAKRYADWKWRITPSSRDPDTPNLFITGPFHKSVYAVRQGEVIQFGTNTGLGNKVTSKFTTVLGVMPKNLDVITRKIIFPKLIPEIKTYLRA